MKNEADSNFLARLIINNALHAICKNLKYDLVTT